MAKPVIYSRKFLKFLGFLIIAVPVLIFSNIGKLFSGDFINKAKADIPVGQGFSGPMDPGFGWVSQGADMGPGASAQASGNPGEASAVGGYGVDSGGVGSGGGGAGGSGGAGGGK